MTDLRDPTECERCGDEYTLRDGDDPTPHCDHCAHELVASLTAEIERKDEALRPFAGLADMYREDVPDDWQERLGIRLGLLRAARAALKGTKP